MIHELYNILSVYVTAGLLLSGGSAFLFVAVPDSPLLRSYRRARIAMAFAYPFFSPSELPAALKNRFSARRNFPQLSKIIFQACGTSRRYNYQNMFNKLIQQP